MKQLFSVFSIALLCASLGCGPEVKQTPTDPKGAASEGDQDKISAALKKAGITKEIGAINDAGDEWLVTLKLDGLGPNGDTSGTLSSWNAAHLNQNCSNTAPRGGAGRTYCFAIN